MMRRRLLLIIGYCCGLIETGYWYGRLKGIDIRKEGSGNSGATNSLRVMGKKAGLIVFLGDVLKCLIPCLIVLWIFKQKEPGNAYLYMVYTATGVILGHNYPCYMNFKGGKGIACTAALILMLDWRTTLVCLALFIITVAITRFVSLGSLLVVTALFIMSVCFTQQGAYQLNASVRMEFCAVILFLTVLAYWRHRANIVRLLHGTENKIGVKK